MINSGNINLLHFDQNPVANNIYSFLEVSNQSYLFIVQKRYLSHAYFESPGKSVHNENLKSRSTQLLQVRYQAKDERFY